MEEPTYKCESNVAYLLQYLLACIAHTSRVFTDLPKCFKLHMKLPYEYCAKQPFVLARKKADLLYLIATYATNSLNFILETK